MLPHCSQALLTRYNIGIDAEKRNREMVEKTAARVGFVLPSAGGGEGATVGSQQQQPQQQQHQQQASGAGSALGERAQEQQGSPG